MVSRPTYSTLYPYIYVTQVAGKATACITQRFPRIAWMCSGSVGRHRAHSLNKCGVFRVGAEGRREAGRAHHIRAMTNGEPRSTAGTQLETPGSERASQTPRSEDGRSDRPDLPLVAGAGRTVSLISSLIHVRVPASITVYYRALNWVYTPAWPVLDDHPTS